MPLSAANRLRRNKSSASGARLSGSYDFCFLSFLTYVVKCRRKNIIPGTMSNRPRENGPDKKRHETNAPVASSSPSPIHEEVVRGARGNVDKVLPDWDDAPRGLTDVPEAPLKKIQTSRKIDPDEIDPDRAFGSDQEELLDKLEHATSDRLPIPKPLPIPKQPPPFTPKQKPVSKRPTTRGMKRRPFIDRLNNHEPSAAKKALDAILRGLKKINPFS